MIDVCPTLPLANSSWEHDLGHLWRLSTVPIGEDTTALRHYGMGYRVLDAFIKFR